jgi:putative Mg2+ transporter-C (MgtC) family protein
MIGFNNGSRELEFVLRMGSALLVGCAVGLERQYHQRIAGTRTNALVAAGAAAFTMAGAALTTNMDSQARIAAQIVSGIGFLGAGVIFKEGANVHGLNTAATIWCSAAIGTLFGMGQYFLGLLTGAIVLVTNVALRPLAVKLHPMQPPTKEQGVCYSLVVDCPVERQGETRELLLQQFASTPLTVIGLESKTASTPSRAKVVVSVRCVGRHDEVVEQAIRTVSAGNDIQSASWTLSTQILE